MIPSTGRGGEKVSCRADLLVDGEVFALTFSIYRGIDCGVITECLQWTLDVELLIDDLEQSVRDEGIL